MELIYDTRSIAIVVSETADVGEARRRVLAVAREVGFAESTLSDLGILATEAASNVVRHGKGGEIVVRPLARGDARGIELLALDKGSGMVEVGRCLADGFSTGGTAGTGLGAMRRIAHEFDVHSVAGLGTAILLRLWKDDVRPPARDWDVGAVCVPIKGETECGDAWQVVETADTLSVLVADGLGHGPHAAAASSEAVRAFGETARKGALGSLDAIHAALRKTRGAAAAVVALDRDMREARFAGVGNIAGYIFADKWQGLASVNGTAGHDVRKLQEFSYSLAGFRALVLHSDGLNTRWTLDEPKYAGLLLRDPALLAGILYRDFNRGRDDATCVVLRGRWHA